MNNIYLIRTGFTPANNADYNNQRGLSEIATDSYMPLEIHYGRKQAEELGKYLNTIMGKTLILVSSYNRTLETLEIALRNMHGDYKVEVRDELHEINLGVHFARTKEEILELYPVSGKDFYMAKHFFSNATCYIDGESQRKVKYRVYNISNYIMEKSLEYDNVFVVAHGTVNKWIYYWINDEQELNHDMKNCEVIRANGRNRGKPLFIPQTFVPKGYMIDINEYIHQKQNKVKRK